MHFGIGDSNPNDKQVGGAHYRTGYQHWDFVADARVGYHLGCATKYLSRWKGKHNYPSLLVWIAKLMGRPLPSQYEDLEKSLHYIAKAIELCCAKGYVPVVKRLPDQLRAEAVQAVKDFCKAQGYHPDFRDPEARIIRNLVLWKDKTDLEVAAATLNEYILTLKGLVK